MTSFHGIEIARRALSAHQAALQVTGHNIANANSPGYTRQVATLSATDPFPTSGLGPTITPGQRGTGVELSAIRRMSSDFIQSETVREMANEGYWTELQEILRRAEMAMLEPGSSGVQASLGQYWESLQELHKNPESLAVRAVVRESALTLAETIRYVRDQLVPLQTQFDSAVRAGVAELNRLAEQVAALNADIAKANALGHTPADLFDRRDLLVQEMSRLSGARVAMRAQGMVAVSVGGIAIVDGLTTRQIEVVAGSEPISKLVWEGGERDVQIGGGRLQALLQGRDEWVPTLVQGIDQMARELIQATNDVHQAGVTLTGQPGGNFFEGDGASNIALAPLILQDLEHIAAAGVPDDWDPDQHAVPVANGDNALRMAQIRHERVVDGNATLETFHTSLVSRLAIASQKATRMVEHQATVSQHLLTLRESISGVSIDEEMTNLVMYQHGYAAAARLVSVVDEALDTLINRMGLVGR